MSEQRTQVQVVEPTSPMSPSKIKNGDDSSTIQLSPRTDNSKKLISQQTPQISKNKLDVLRNIYEKALGKVGEAKQLDEAISQKEQQLDGYKLILEARSQQQSSTNLSHIHEQKKAQITQLETQLQNLRSNHKLTEQHNHKISHLNELIKAGQQKRRLKQQEHRHQLIQSQIEKIANQLRSNVYNLQTKKTQIHQVLNHQQTKVTDKKKEVQSLSSKLLDQKNKNSQQGTSANDEKPNQLTHQIQTKKQQLQKLRSELQNKAKAQVPSVHQPENIIALKSQIQEIKRTQLDSQKSLQLSKKQLTEAINKVKTNQKNIQKQKSKITQISEKTKKLEHDKSELEGQLSLKSQTKKIKYQQKVPEQINELKQKRQNLEKILKQQDQKLQKQQSLYENLVPPTIIQNFKLKIQKIVQRNQQYTKFVKQNNTLVQQNKQLDIVKESLEWEVNPEITTNESNKKQEQIKLNKIEQQVNIARKVSIQVTNKLQQYQKSYPEFKPEKKAKKPEPVAVAAPKKQQQKGANKKNNKNVKATKVSPPKLPEIQQVKVVKQQKTTKSKQQKTTKSKQVKSKVEQKPKIEQKPKVEQKTVVVKKASPPKVEQTKVEQVKKVDEIKQPQQQNKNKNKKKK